MPNIVLTPHKLRVLRIVESYQRVILPTINAIMGADQWEILNKLRGPGLVTTLKDALDAISTKHDSYQIRHSRTARGGSFPDIYLLTKRGAEALTAAFPGFEPRWGLQQSELGYGILDHTLQIGKFGAALHRSAREIGARVFEAFDTDFRLPTRWKVELRGKRVEVVPDRGFVVFLPWLVGLPGRNPHKIFPFELERTNITGRSTSDKYSLRLKHLKYAKTREQGVLWEQYNISNFRTLSLLKTPEKAASLRSMMERRLKDEKGYLPKGNLTADYSILDKNVLLEPWLAGDGTPIVLAERSGGHRATD